MKKQLFIFVFVLLLLPFIQACDDSTNNQNGGTGGNTDAGLVVGNKLSFDKSSIDLGEVALGSKMYFEVKITNITDSMVHFEYSISGINSPYITNTAECRFNGIDTGVDLEARKSCVMKITVEAINPTSSPYFYVYIYPDRIYEPNLPIKYTIKPN